MNSKPFSSTLRDIRGVPFPDDFPEEAARWTMQFQPKPADVMICTYPKSGTTWMQQTVLLILNKGQPINDFLQWTLASPFIDCYGKEIVERDPRPQAMKTHFPLTNLKWSSEAKYIHVIRNPIDACVSFYFHIKFLYPDFKDMSFDEFFELYLSSQVPYGSFLKHMTSFYEHYGEPNIIFITYEEMKKSPEKVIKDVAKFLGEEYASAVEEADVMEKILHYSSIGYMREHFNKSMKEFYQKPTEEIEKIPGIPQSIVNFHRVRSERLKSTEKFTFVRKGALGDADSIMNEEQKKRFIDVIKSAKIRSELLQIWGNIYCLDE